jgi:hypothetical protein
VAFAILFLLGLGQALPMDPFRLDVLLVRLVAPIEDLGNECLFHHGLDNYGHVALASPTS